MKNLSSTVPATILHLFCVIASLFLTQSLYILAKNSTLTGTQKISETKTNLQVLKNRMDSISYSGFLLLFFYPENVDYD